MTSKSDKTECMGAGLADWTRFARDHRGSCRQQGILPETTMREATESDVESQTLFILTLQVHPAPTATHTPDHPA